MKTISVIIPAKNEERYLPRCLASLARQTYPKDKVEVIVVDNGSTDRTREIAESFGAKVLCVPQGNIARLRNEGARVAVGELLVFLDADCVVPKDWLERGADHAADKAVRAWGGPIAPPRGATWVQKTWLLVTYPGPGIRDVDWLGTADLFVRRSDFLSLGGFSDALATCEDVDFCYRLARGGRIVCDAAMQVTHLREPATLSEFFRKEVWRGNSNWEGVRSHGLRWKELPSLAIPAYYGVLLPVTLLLALFSGDSTWLVFAALLVFPAGSVAYKASRKGPLPWGDALRLAMLLQVYFLARTWSVLTSSKA